MNAATYLKLKIVLFQYCLLAGFFLAPVSAIPQRTQKYRYSHDLFSAWAMHHGCKNQLWNTEVCVSEKCHQDLQGILNKRHIEGYLKRRAASEGKAWLIIWDQDIM